MQNENVRLVGRIPVVPRSDPGGVYSVYVRGLRLLIKRPTNVRIRTWGFFQGEESINLRARGSGKRRLRPLTPVVTPNQIASDGCDLGGLFPVRFYGCRVIYLRTRGSRKRRLGFQYWSLFPNLKPQCFTSKVRNQPT